MNSFDINKQKHIEKKYRPIPFWSWNDKLDPELLRWQVREMEMAGLGGFFMHARGGLQTEYLGDEWMECVDACIDESKKTSMEAWLYDEDGWPSGFGGGKVTALGDKYHGRWLVISEYDTKEVIEEAGNLLGIYEYNGKYLAVNHKSNPYYIDVMSQSAVAAFIECTHQHYYETFPEEFEGTVKGFFTDEPRFSGDFEGDIPWSYDIPEAFLKEHGYDILAHLHALFVECEGYEKVRYDFYQITNSLFVSSFMKQIQSWCNEHNCKLTGHLMMEESIFTQMTGTTGVMPFYEYMDVPGIDWLRRTISSPVVPRQVSSVAHQLDKKQVLTESFALTGWNVRMEELKWIADWQFVNGVTLLCQHLEGYTLRGLRKRDYPPSLFYQIPWWEKYNILNDYSSRIGKMQSEGEYMADILLIHPMRSGWIVYEGNQNEAIKKLDDDFTAAAELLSGIQAEYDFGDEGIIKKYGSVKEGKLEVGKGKYSAVVLPSVVTLDENTVYLLNEFIEAGGTVISIGDIPTHQSGKEGSKELETLIESALKFDMNTEKKDIERTLNELGVLKRKLTDKNTGENIEAVHGRSFIYEGALCTFLVNHLQEEAFDTQLAIKGEGRLYEMDLITGDLSEVMDTAVKDGHIVTYTVFEPMQSRMYVIIDDASENKAGSDTENTCVVMLGTEWDIEEMTENALTLDMCEYKIDDGAWQDKKAVIHIFNELVELKKSCRIALRFKFDAECEKETLSDAFLAIERADEFDITVNGKKVAYADNGFWVDSSFLKVNVGSLVTKGSNEIILEREFYQSDNVYHVLFDEGVYETELNKLTYDVELESIYLVGSFGVNSLSDYTYGDRKACFTEGPFVLTELDEKTNGNMTVESMPFFAGKVSLGQDFELDMDDYDKVILKLERPCAAVSEVWINGELIKALPWAPYEADITKAVKSGTNRLTMKLFSGNRNLLGPHHHINGEIYNVGPDSFTGKWSWVEKSSEATPATEEERNMSYWKDRYCFVKFGMQQ